MRLPHRYAYLQARLQARYAMLPSEQEWERLMATRTLSAFLEEARAGPLREWVKGFSAQSDVHDMEAAVRGLFRESVTEVSSWVPAAWREAVAWIAWLPLLPLLAQAGRGERLPRWTRRDTAARALLDSDGEFDAQRLRRAGAGPLIEREVPLKTARADAWRGRWPACSARDRAAMDALLKQIARHAAAFRDAAPEQTWALRRELRERLRLRFEIFVRALGVPGGDEADPTPLLALVVPLLFGYMFGDVGQGLVLVAAGWRLRRRFGLAWLLVAGGISAILFGFLFGSLFASEALIPPLWLHPMDDPLTVLVVPLIFAVGLLSLGQILSGLSALWRGELTRWLLVDGGSWSSTSGSSGPRRASSSTG